MGILANLKSAYIEVPVADENVWHKRLRAPPFTRAVSGKFLDDVGQIWRRRRPDGSYEYRQDPETQEHWEARAW